MTKEEFRIKYKSWRSLLTEEERRYKSSGITKHLLEMLKEKQYKCIHIFISSEKLQEPDTSELISFLLKASPSVKLCTSKLVSGEPRQLICEINSNTQWQINRWGISEPIESNIIDAAQIDMILIPLLAYDVNGNRVGYGKGYYDELIQWCRVDVKKMGLSFFEPDEDSIPTEKWDQTLDIVVTPDGVLTFKK
ncbi:MAG: 5-formyltetrahydrofolate cyclo-ligase [Cytophagaceae bacterium]